MMVEEYREIIENAWANRVMLRDEKVQSVIRTCISRLDEGKLRVAEPEGEGWKINEWVKKAVILYFPIQQMEVIEVGPFVFHDKMKLKQNYVELGVRVVPHGIARYGAFLGKGVIMMP